MDNNNGYAAVILSEPNTLQACSTPDRQECVSLWREEGESKPIGSEQQSSCHFLCSWFRREKYILLQRWHTIKPDFIPRGSSEIKFMFVLAEAWTCSQALFSGLFAFVRLWFMHEGQLEHQWHPSTTAHSDKGLLGSGSFEWSWQQLSRKSLFHLHQFELHVHRKGKRKTNRPARVNYTGSRTWACCVVPLILFMRARELIAQCTDLVGYYHYWSQS